MLTKKTASCKDIKGDSKEGDKKDEGYKKTNGLEVSSREGFAKFIHEFSYLDPIK